MAVVNHTSEVIILPSRHKLHPGDNTDISDAVLRVKRNKHFCDLLLGSGKISLGYADAKKRIEKPAPLVGTPKTRFELASAKGPEVLNWAGRMGITTTHVDDAREALAEMLFEGVT